MAKPKPKANEPSLGTRSATTATAGNQTSGGRGQATGGPGEKSLIDREREYLAGLQRAIAANKFYPEEAREQQLQGRVLVAFTILADGSLTNIRVRKGSGSKPLDDAAIAALRRLGRYRPIPPEFSRQRWPLRVPINFALQ